LVDFALKQEKWQPIGDFEFRFQSLFWWILLLNSNTRASH